MNPFESIETRRLLLRCVNPSDAAATSALMTAEISRWLASWPYLFARRIDSMRDMAFKGDALPLAVVAKTNNELAGWVTLSRDAADGRHGSLGYLLGVHHQGYGFMKEAVPTALSVAFKSMNLDVVEAGAQPENERSFAIMQFCGMRMVGERMLYAPARARNELCRFYEIERSDVVHAD